MCKLTSPPSEINLLTMYLLYKGWPGLGRGGKAEPCFLKSSLFVFLIPNPSTLDFLWSVTSDDERGTLSVSDESLVDFGGGGLPGAPLGGKGRDGMIFPWTGLEIMKKA